MRGAAGADSVPVVSEKARQQRFERLLTALGFRDQAQMARSLDIDPKSVSKYAGGKVPSRDPLRKIAKAAHAGTDAIVRYLNGLSPLVVAHDDGTETTLDPNTDVLDRGLSCLIGDTDLHEEEANAIEDVAIEFAGRLDKMGTRGARGFTRRVLEVLGRERIDEILR